MGVGDGVTLSSFTTEGVNYIMECGGYRKEGIKKRYGELSRSGYQNNAEYRRYIKKGVVSHPLVQHFWRNTQEFPRKSN